jgi:Domain of unknown function (DUF4388)
MSFQGTLDLFGLADILRMLAATGKRGGLLLRRDGAEGGVWLADGAVAWAAARSGPAPLARRLFGRGAVAPEALAAAVRQAGTAGSLTAALLDAEAIAADRLGEVAAEHVADELFDLARWSDGSFRFEPDAAPPEALDPPLPVEEALAETERRLAAWPEIVGRVPGPSARLALPLGPPVDAGKVAVDADEWRFLAAVGGSRTVTALVDEAGQGEFRTCQALAAMVERGLLVVADEATGAAPGEQALRAALALAGGGGAGATAEPAALVHPAAEAARSEEAAGAEPGPGGDAAGPAAAPGLGTEPDAEALLEQLISGVRGL